MRQIMLRRFVEYGLRVGKKGGEPENRLPFVSKGFHLHTSTAVISRCCCDITSLSGTLVFEQDKEGGMR